MRVQDWNENFTNFVIDSINEIYFPYQGGENGILNYYAFDPDVFCTRCQLNSKYLIFQTILNIDFDYGDTEAKANCINGIETYIREALGFEEEVELSSYEAGESSYYGGKYKIALKFKINKYIQDNLIALAKIKGYKI